MVLRGLDVSTKCRISRGFSSKVYTDFSSDIDQCAATPCKNGATCTDKLNDYDCQCEAGWTGKNCTQSKWISGLEVKSFMLNNYFHHYLNQKHS